MRQETEGTSAFLVGISAIVLTASILLSGCASKGARHESSLYPDGHLGARHSSRPANRQAALVPPKPQPAVRGYVERHDGAQPLPRFASDEARYSAIYGVPPREDYLNDPQPNGQEDARQGPQGYDAQPLQPLRPLRSASPRAQRPSARSRTYRQEAAPAPRAARRIVVTRGDTLYNIAWRYKTTVPALLRANRLANGNLEVGQEIVIPATR